ncbi:MAG: CBS domain-containing protein [Burkholderiaceae bacterium]|jgi:CBS domain-containing protein|nr:CBS domain-containing protein [Burkholderiaceae bacterium]
MYDQPLRDVMDTAKVLRVPPTMTVAQAAREMARVGIGAVLVMQDAALIGIFTERDAVYRVVARALDVDATPVSAVMTPQPKTLAADRPFGVALALMHKHGFRHVPVMDAGEVVGMVYARMALDPDMEDFVAEARRRDRYVAVE